MTKVLLLLSAVVMAVACFFGYQNRQAFVEARLKRQENVWAIGTEFKALEVAASEVSGIKGNIRTVSDEKAQEEGKLEQFKITLKNKQADLDRTNQDLTSTTNEIKDIKGKRAK